MSEREPERGHDPQADAPGDLPSVLADQACARLLAAAEPSEQEAVLAELCGSHPEHAAALRRMHGELRGVDQVLGRTLAATGGEDLAVIGAYRVLRRLGEGAFGVVYLCAQEAPIRRRVAVKVLRPGAGRREVLARFQGERQVLARMNHPAIANVFDAGALPDGRPFFVMEHVDGSPITTWCDERRLPLPERVALFLALCEGVQHAHARGIIHRDLKPSNVLVCEVQGQAQPKVIDFGLAKLLHEPLETDGDLTRTGGVVGTPGFMSPEQSGGRPEDVDTRSDIFSLGVILYVLLTGEMPWRRAESTADAPAPRPSTRLSSASEQADSAAARRSAEPRRLLSQVRGDLDWITLRALERERDRRYQTVRELAEDLRRHLRHEPVLAGPPSRVYRLRKLVRRYRLQVAAAAAVLVSLLLGLFGTVRYAAKANENLQRFEILALGRRLALARASVSTLFPPWPERLADFDRWLEEHGRPLRGELPRLRRSLTDLRAFAVAESEADPEATVQPPGVAEVELRRAKLAYIQALLDHPALQGEDSAQVRDTLAAERGRLQADLPRFERLQEERRTWRVASGGQQFLHDTMVRLEDELRQFCDGEASAVEVIEAQRRGILAGLADLEQRRAAWDRVRAAVAADPRYEGLQLAPQFDLVPVGADPVSGLQEFYHRRSGPLGGAVPERTADGRLELGVEAGIVFVLLPPGRAVLGAQSLDPDAPHYDPNASRSEGPVHEVALAPFFLGKHEVTQSQWRHLTDTLPSHFHKNVVTSAGPAISERHPVENVDWYECHRGLAKHGLDLPTEAQWEYACRAGTTTIWWTGDDSEDVEGQEGHRAFHAAVGSQPPNAFGLHDMAGNVAEWCRDTFSSLAYLLPAAPGDGLRPVPDMKARVVRGGSFQSDAREGASAARHAVGHNTHAQNVGVRAARRVVHGPTPRAGS